MKKLISSLLFFCIADPTFAILNQFQIDTCTKYQTQVQNTINSALLLTKQTYIRGTINGVTKDQNNNIAFTINNIADCQGFCSPNTLNPLRARLTNANRTISPNDYLKFNPGALIEICGSFLTINNRETISIGVPELNQPNLQNPGFLNVNGNQFSTCNGVNAFCIDLLTIQNAH